MPEKFAQIEKLLELQKRQAERDLKNVLDVRERFLSEAQHCARAGDEAARAAINDVADAVAAEQWARAQKARAGELRQKAQDLQPEIAGLTTALRTQLRRKAGYDEMVKMRRARKAREMEEQADDEMLSVAQLSGTADG